MLPRHFTFNGKSISAIAAFSAALVFMVPASAGAAECPNEQLREESLVNPVTGQPYSMQLPDCRAYELVSPPDTGGMPAVLEGHPSVPHEVLVTAGGSVFWQAQAKPPGTGAMPDGGYLDVFRSQRGNLGWTTTDLLPHTQAGNKTLLAASANGAAVLIETTLTLTPEDLDDPTGNVTTGNDLYVLREGDAPELVTHGEVPNRPIGEIRVAADETENRELSAVGFETDDSLAAPLHPGGLTPGCYVWSDSEEHLARLTNPVSAEPEHHRNCRYLGVAADGRAVIEDTSGDGAVGLIFATDPAPNSGFPSEGGTRQLSGATPGAATFDALSPNDEVVYLATPDKLLTSADGDHGSDIYGVDLQAPGLSSGSPPTAPAVTCESCQSDGSANSADAVYVGQSSDGSHLYFTIEGTLYQHDSAGTQELASAADQLNLGDMVSSENGTFVVAQTTVPLSTEDVDGTSDLYELSAGAAPRLLTRGIAVANYKPVAVSNAGQPAVFETTPEGAGPSVVSDWSPSGGGQLSPVGATTSYSVLSTSGPQLEDVFFAAHESLVIQDANGGTVDIYDAREDGGYPAIAQARGGNQTPDPIASPVTSYAQSLPHQSPLIPALSPGSVAAPVVRRRKPHTDSCDAKAKRKRTAKKRRAAMKKCGKVKTRNK